MATTFYLIRHAQKEGGEGWLPGRMPGVGLSEEGREQAERLAEALALWPLDAILCSPVQRAQETAAPLAARLGMRVETSEAITEIDFGEWTGGLTAQLDETEPWQQFNAFRSGAPVPNGEWMVRVQARFVEQMLALRAAYADGAVALFSHGDPIRAALAYFLGVPLDLFQRIQIDSASISIVALEEWGARVRGVNSKIGGALSL